MHPDKVPSEYPSKDKHVDSAERETSETNPSKAGQSFKDSVMKLYASDTAKRQKSAKQANNIYNFRAKNAFPAVFF